MAQQWPNNAFLIFQASSNPSILVRIMFTNQFVPQISSIHNYSSGEWSGKEVNLKSIESHQCPLVQYFAVSFVIVGLTALMVNSTSTSKWLSLLKSTGLLIHSFSLSLSLSVDHIWVSYYFNPSWRKLIVPAPGRILIIPLQLIFLFWPVVLMVCVCVGQSSNVCLINMVKRKGERERERKKKKKEESSSQYYDCPEPSCSMFISFSVGVIRKYITCKDLTCSVLSYSF